MATSCRTLGGALRLAGLVRIGRVAPGALALRGSFCLAMDEFRSMDRLDSD